MKITEQQTKIITILKTKLENKADPKTIELIYEKEHKNKLGNIYEQLNRLLEEGIIKKISNTEYSLTVAGKNLLETKKTVREPSILFSEKDIKEFEEFSKNTECLKRLTQMTAPHLLGLEKEKLACLASAVSVNDQGTDRNRIHTLLVGPPSCGKSQLIKSIVNQLWGQYCDSNTSASGLKGRTAGDQFKPGLIQKANGSVLVCDELDKYHSQDQAGLLTAMESGIITTVKDGIKRTDETSIRVLAAANKENTIIEPLKSRFDIILQVKKLTPEEEEKLIRKRTNEWNRTTTTINPEFFKNYLQYARQQQTTLPEDRETLTAQIILERQSGKLQGKDIRQIETIYRLTLAIAKLQLKKEADIECLRTALEVLE